jgi:hypothetical protein
VNGNGDRHAADGARGGAAAALRFLAFYLPQFHPIPENDEWWGKGFTEWTNVTRAQPRFRDHYQPHRPADLGFYDLRLPEVRQAQADLARAFGIDGFCYYHYWFHGKRLLERPFNEVLASGEPDFPFALCWANENWSRTWDGHARRYLLAQVYCEDDDLRHIRWLCEAFADPRYIRVDGKPVFLVYRTSELPDPKRTSDIWREEAQRLGIGEIYLCHIEAWSQDRGVDPASIGFDAGVEFQPDSLRLGPELFPRREQLWRYEAQVRRALRRKVPQRDRIYDYETVVDLSLREGPRDYPWYRCVTPGWDNSARRKTGARILHGSTPEHYERWVRGIVDRFEPYSADENLVFVNAWNEWAEGNHLEPDQRFGRRYLEAHRAATGTGPGAPRAVRPEQAQPARTERSRFQGVRDSAAWRLVDQARRRIEARPRFDGDDERVFVCGWHGTGTTTLHVALEELGYRVHGDDAELTERVIDGALDEVWLGGRGATAFRGLPWSLLFAEADRRFPTAKFILTTRDTAAWLESCTRHHERIGPTPVDAWLYGADRPHGNGDAYTARYERHNREVRAHFRGRPGKLLELDPSKGDGWDRLAKFLGRAVPATPFPHAASHGGPLPPPTSITLN